MTGGSPPYQPRHAAELEMDTATLTAADRCDACGAQAYVRAVTVSLSELLMCGHHFHRHEAALLAQDALIFDETWRLHQKLDSSP